MSDAGRMLARYLEQRKEMGEAWIVLPQPGSRGGTDDTGGQGDTDDRDGAGRGARTLRRAAGASGVATGRGGEAGRWRKGAPPIPERGITVPPPSKDLFTEDPLAHTSLDEVATLVRTCTVCRLCDSRTNAVPGEGPPDARLVVVGEGPGAREDETGRPFVGRAGELLTEILAAIEQPRDSVFICNVVKCRPPDNRKPLPEEIAACVPYLYRQLEIIQPAVILAMGGTAAETLLGVRQPLGALRNKVHEFRGIPLVVTYHPAALLRNPHWKKPTWDDVRVARQLLDRRR